MDEWNRCAEGFVGVKKLNKVINKIKNQDESNRSREVKSTVSITCQDSPDQKKKFKQCHSHGGSSKVPLQSKAFLQSTWKPDVFFEDFKSFTEGDSPQLSNGIECTSSSSSDNSGTEEDLKSKSGRNVSRNERLGKNKRTH
ncbi:hypothetical protein EGW08_011577, partial [Elysia chlorotica]